MAVSLSAVTEAIRAYTGLSPAAFFTIAALMVGVYFIVSSFFVAPSAPADTEAQRAPPPELLSAPAEPVYLGDVTSDEMRAYDGSDPTKPLLIAIKGEIYDVSKSRIFYGPGGPYALFAGQETSRALALMSFDPIDLNDNLEGLGPPELEVLSDWELKFKEKYAKVGQVVSDKSAKNTSESAHDGNVHGSVQPETMKENGTQASV